ncbi:unnamed protein product, partial [Owenia fusiformis]
HNYEQNNCIYEQLRESLLCVFLGSYLLCFHLVQLSQVRMTSFSSNKITRCCIRKKSRDQLQPITDSVTSDFPPFFCLILTDLLEASFPLFSSLFSINLEVGLRIVIMARPSVLLTGHSFISRLSESQHQDLDLRDTDYVYDVGHGGAKVDNKSPKNLSVLSSEVWKPYDVVVFQIGENDLSHHNNQYDVIYALQGLHDLVSIVRRANRDCKVVIGELFYRDFSNDKNCRFTCQEDCEVYNKKIKKFNTMLRTFYADFDYVLVWKHQGMKENWKEMVGHDGTHLSSWGLQKFSSSLRGAVIQGKKLLTQHGFRRRPTGNTSYQRSTDNDRQPGCDRVSERRHQRQRVHPWSCPRAGHSATGCRAKQNN